MAKAYTFDELMAKNKKIANTYISGVGDEESGEVIDVPNDPAASKKLYGVIPSKGYTEWLMAGGMNGQAQKAYDATVRAAETDYAKTLALYGQNAETLGRAGLTGSGYSDYLTGAGFSAMQGAKVAAADTKALTEAQQRLSYADYLAGVDAQNAQLAAQENAKQEALAAEQEATAANIKSTIDAAIQQGMDDKAIMAMIQQHYGNDFDSYLSGWIANAHTYNDPLVAQNAQGAADAASAKYREEIFNRLKAGVDPAIVRSDIEYVMKFSGADTSQLDAWIAEAQAAAQPTVDALNAEKTKAETEAANALKQAALKDYSNMIASGFTSADAAEQLRLAYDQAIVDYAIQTHATAEANAAAETQAEVADALLKNLEYEGLTLEAIPTAAQLHNAVVNGEITEGQAEHIRQRAAQKRFDILAQKFEDLADMEATAATDAVAQWRDIIDNASSEDLTDIQRAQLYGMYSDALLSTNIELKRPVSEMLDDIRTLDRDQIGEAAYNGVVDGFLDAVAIPDTVAKAYNSASDAEYTMNINCGKRANGKEVKQRIDFSYTSIPAERQRALGDQALGGEVKALDGKLYVYDAGQNAWWLLTRIKNSDVAGKENADLMYDILVRYYSSRTSREDNYRGQGYPSEKHKNA